MPTKPQDSRPEAPNLIVLEKRTGRLVATDAAAHIGPNLLHGQWSSPSAGVVRGKKLIFFGGGDGFCYAFEALDSVPAKPVKLKTVWSFDCNPPEYKSFGGLDWATHYSLGDKRLKKSLNKANDGSFVGMSEIISTPVFYKDRVYVAIGRDPEHGRGRGPCGASMRPVRATLPRPAAAGATRAWIGRYRQSRLPTDCSTSSTWPAAYTASTRIRADCHWVYETRSAAWGSTYVADGKVLRADPEISPRHGGRQGTASPGEDRARQRGLSPRPWLRMGRCTSRRPAIFGRFRSRNEPDFSRLTRSPAKRPRCR